MVACKRRGGGQSSQPVSSPVCFSCHNQPVPKVTRRHGLYSASVWSAGKSPPMTQLPSFCRGGGRRRSQRGRFTEAPQYCRGNGSTLLLGEVEVGWTDNQQRKGTAHSRWLCRA